MVLPYACFASVFCLLWRSREGCETFLFRRFWKQFLQLRKTHGGQDVLLSARCLTPLLSSNHYMSIMSPSSSNHLLHMYGQWNVGPFMIIRRHYYETLSITNVARKVNLSSESN